MNNPAFDPREFLTELCRYYLEFLQSDFRDKLLPARRVAFRNKDGLLTDISLAPYPGLNRTALNLLTDGFHRNPFTKIDRHTFAGAPPEEPTGMAKENGSLYGALYELWKNKQLLDRQDFYLSFLDIAHNNVTYPIFYVPIGIELTAGSFSFEFDPVLFINSKAIEYVSQEFAEATKKEWKIDLPPRHIYLSNFEQNGDLLGYLRNIMTEITSFFGVEELDLSQYAETGNEHVSISTRCYLSLCDKSDESIINDYEELLTLVQAGCDTRALDIFSKISSGYLFENPESFERQIEEDFDSLPVSERLVYESPIPLNREQIQILKAIDTKGCDRIIVEGPPGTGKSHTIAAIIDEASQVSIAQAFPLILRAKKTVVLGDPRQYANVKSHNASISVNNYLFNRVKAAFDKSIAILDAPQREMIKDKVHSFDVKNSILYFLINISNYQCSLKKHFRSYGELIGYSNETFYQGSLQIMKIRGKPIRDVIQFHRVSPPHSERYKNTNETEAGFILAELNRLKQAGFQGTVGVITPFTNQQRLISNLVYSSDDWRFFHERFKFAAMTFDSCQGNEKDIIYYSMVEKEHEDILRYVFPIKLENIAEEEEGNLKAQRLNVGFSRAKESVRFVLSEDAESIWGEIGKAIRHYKGQLEKPDVLTRTDASSPMEPILYRYITQTPFYEENTDRIEIIPQFDIGRYIKQLNPYARIPNYRSDFLMLYREATGKDRMVILEYDGFEHHFKDDGHVDAGNFERFYVEEDIERRRTIESYGYRFIRFNKFVLGNDPVGYINERLERQFGKSLNQESRARIAGTHEKIETGGLTQCVECGTHKYPDEFGGSSMETGRDKIRLVGRNGHDQPLVVRPLATPSQEAMPKCPKCQSPMVLRNGAYGTFYGCSRYPDCKGTKRAAIDKP